MKKTDENSNIENGYKSLQTVFRKVTLKTKMICVFVLLGIGIFAAANVMIKNSDSVGDPKNLSVQQYQVTPQMYGAKGDGKTDDTKAFQEALNNNRSLYVPAGTYLVGDLVMPWGVTITGDSATTTILKAKEGTNTVLQMDSNTQSAARLYKLSVDCDAKAEFGIRYPKISIGTDKDMTLYNLLLQEVYVSRALDTGISIESMAIEARIFEVRTMYSEGTGCSFRGTDSIFISCMFAESKGNGLYIKGANNRISDSKAYLNGTNSDEAGIVVDGDTCLFENIEVQQNYTNGMIINGCGNIVRGLMDGNNALGKREQLAQIVLTDNAWYNTIDVTVMSWKFYNFQNEEQRMLPQYGVICRGTNQIFNDIKLTAGGIDDYYNRQLVPENSMIPFYVEHPSPLNQYECNGEKYYATESIEMNIVPSYQDYGTETVAENIDSSTVKFTVKNDETELSARYVIHSAEMEAALSTLKAGDTVFITGKAKVPSGSMLAPQISYKNSIDNANSGWAASSSLSCVGMNYSPFYVAIRDIKPEDSDFKLGFLMQKNSSEWEEENEFYVKDLKLYVIPKTENEIFDIEKREVDDGRK